MWRMGIAILAACVALPASAHLLKVFATVDHGSVTGYAFFLGGGRPSAGEIIIKNESGSIVHHGQTNNNGEFAWQPPKPGQFTIIVNARDGHIAKTTLERSRFPATLPPQQAASSEPAKVRSCSPQQLRQLVNQAVARQIRPLLEAHAHAVARDRITDIVSGISMIIGLAGLGMWGFSRRRNRRDGE